MKVLAFSVVVSRFCCYLNAESHAQGPGRLCIRLTLLLALAAATVIIWDGQVRDGYKRTQESQGPKAARSAWDGARTSTVVEELLRNSEDRAYGSRGDGL